MKKTPLNKIHKDSGAKLVDFNGWEMPVQYTSIIKEHEAVRKKCGIFDVSHMGEIIIKGQEAFTSVQKLITNDISQLKKGGVMYTPMCAPNGGILDDVIVYFLDEDKFMLVVNASNIDKDWEWIKNHVSNNKCDVCNQSQAFALLALQGPLSRNILDDLVDYNLKQLNKFHWIKSEIENEEILISRTGYTGELGYELYVSSKKAEKIWKLLINIGKQYDLVPAGLGARNTLRLEKKLCLYGNDITEDNHPLEAGLGWTVKFDKNEFIGKNALLKIKNEGYDQVLKGFIMKDRGIPRNGYSIEVTGKTIGKVTSGSFSPTLKENIGLGYINKNFADIGREINIIIRNKKYKAEIVKTPFV